MLLRATLREFVSAPSLAACAAWAAVWLAAGSAMAADPVLGWGLRIALVAFLLLLMFEHVAWERFGRGGFLAIAVVLVALALWITAMTPRGASPILLVLLAGMLAAHLGWRALLVALGAINLALAAVVFAYWQAPPGMLVTIVLAYASFQAFAALLMRYAAQAQAMSEELRTVNADLVATRELLAESARDTERLRLSRELHDVAGHKLTALKINLAALARDPRHAGDGQVALCAQLADELMADIRGMAAQMRRDDDGFDLEAALAALAAPFPRPQAHIQIAPTARIASLAQAEAVLRTVQEGLTNTARHSLAQNLWVVLRRHDDTLQLDIRDDGRGTGELHPGTGLTGMRERLESVGGGLQVQRTGTGGVHLQAWFPVAA